jgi:hypothetical protein
MNMPHRPRPPETGKHKLQKRHAENRYFFLIPIWNSAHALMRQDVTARGHFLAQNGDAK